MILLWIIDLNQAPTPRENGVPSFIGFRGSRALVYVLWFDDGGSFSNYRFLSISVTSLCWSCHERQQRVPSTLTVRNGRASKGALGDLDPLQETKYTKGDQKTSNKSQGSIQKSCARLQCSFLSGPLRRAMEDEFLAFVAYIMSISFLKHFLIYTHRRVIRFAMVWHWKDESPVLMERSTREKYFTFCFQLPQALDEDAFSQDSHNTGLYQALFHDSRFYKIVISGFAQFGLWGFWSGVLAPPSYREPCDHSLFLLIRYYLATLFNLATTVTPIKLESEVIPSLWRFASPIPRLWLCSPRWNSPVIISQLLSRAVSVHTLPSSWPTPSDGFGLRFPKLMYLRIDLGQIWSVNGSNYLNKIRSSCPRSIHKIPHITFVASRATNSWLRRSSDLSHDYRTGRRVIDTICVCADDDDKPRW